MHFRKKKLKDIKSLLAGGLCVYIIAFYSLVYNHHKDIQSMMISNTGDNSGMKLQTILDSAEVSRETLLSEIRNGEEGQRVVVPTVSGQLSAKNEMRIDGNHKHDNRPHSFLHHGRVIHEFCHRVLSRSVAQSNVLVVSPDVLKETRIAADQAKEDEERLQLIEIMYESQENVVDGGPSQVVNSVAVQEGHVTHLLPSKTNLKKWWNSDRSLRRKDASWFLLAYFMSGDEYKKEENIDEILSPSRSEEFLSEATLTYIVIGVYSKKTSNGDIDMSGLTAVQTLLDAKYKVQLLSSSHFGEISKNPKDDVDDDDGHSSEEEKKMSYHPNHHFKSTKEVKKFLSKGSDMATAISSKHNSKRGRFDALLFATQGLDLAIPSRLSFLALEKLSLCHKGMTGRCDSKLNARALGQGVFQSCPKHHRDIKISFDKRKEGVLMIKSAQNELISEDEELISEDEEDVEIWLGNDNVNKAEAACVRKGKKRSVACTTRVLKQLPSQPRKMLEERHQSLSSSSSVPSKKNLLFILIDPISRNQFLRSLPNTAKVLEKLGFTKFEKYTVVGDNSGPNQAALYTGLPLKGGRDGIKSSNSHGSQQKIWLWDTLRSEGYATLKSEDACVKNSNMVQSLKPETTHGEQLNHMFCFDFDRPNCLGKDMAAKHLINYASEFMKVYSQNHQGGGDTSIMEPQVQPWAAFLSFVDSHEDTMTVISYLDSMLFNLLNDVDLSNTLVVFLSDHGLHYGPTFKSNGERERAEPILYVHVPETQSEMQPKYYKALRANSKLWTTPFDVHETIMDVMLQRETDDKRSYVGSSLIKDLPKSREVCSETPGIPHRFCSILSPDIHTPKKCTFMREPPSVLSFYADIPRKNRPSWPTCETRRRRPKVILDQCQVATTCVKETDCMRNVVAIRKAKGHKGPLEDPFSLQVCPILNNPSNFDTQLKIKIKAKRELVERHRKKESLLTSKAGKPKKMPNILFLEIDSLSESAAERHIPRTLSVLRNHQIVRNKQNKAHCPTGFCSAMFKKTSVVGQNSIPNQLAALSGCSNREIEGENFYLRPSLQHKKETFETWCPKTDVDSPWLFDIVQELGYVTYFGEEFCYDNSPYVVQGNSFEVNADYDMKELFCRISKGVKEIKGADQSLYFLDHDTSKSPDPCIDGRSRQELGFEYIRGIWNAYPDTPKFAYLNSLAAHDYSLDLAYQSLGVEAYDDYLSIFLQEMLGRQDAEDTIIVLRSDHGLQGGPSPVDFSFQVEHMHPFNSLIVPENFHNLSLEALLSNEEKLVTGFDLYKTLRSLIDPRISNNEELNMHHQTVSLQNWSYDLFHDKVPIDRTCQDAKIPLDFCPCVEERTDLMPYFYVGHAEKLSQMKGPKIHWSNVTQKYELESVPGKIYV